MAGSSSSPGTEALKAFLDEKADLYNSVSFIGTDPVQVPHRYTEPADIEIAAFLTAVLAWGRKSVIVSNALRLLAMMPGGPDHFLTTAEEEDLDVFLPFVHRTFNGFDCIYFLRSLRRLTLYSGGLGTVFQDQFARYGTIREAITGFREAFFAHDDPGRTSRHLPDVQKNSAAKRINMFLRWMVRRDRKGVDFGLWDQIPMDALCIPLDVHSGGVARKLGLLKRPRNDWKAVEELTGRLKEMDPFDPVRYDFALFGLGSFEGF